MEETHQIDAEHLRKQRAALADFGHHALREDDLDVLLQEAAELIADATGVKLVKVLEFLADRDVMLIRAGVNWKPGVVGHATFGAHLHSPSGYALQTGEPVISHDLSTEDRFEIPQLLLDHGVKSMVNVVISNGHGAWGVLEVDSPAGRQFSDDDIVFLQTYANLLAAAIERLITHRELAESVERRDLLLSELKHRVRNLLANVQALARRCVDTSASLEEFSERFESRLEALARTQDLLTQHPGEGIRLRDILELELDAHGAAKDHVALKGPKVALPADLAQLLALAVHELATNASKHGALGQEGGRLEVVWTHADDESGALEITWRERNVTVEADPSRRGFGSEMLETALPYMTGGSCQLDFARDGMTCVLVVPTH